MSNVQTILNPQTAAGSGTFDAAAYAGVTFYAVGLAGTEEVDILLGGGPSAVPYCRDDGTPVVLTATAPSHHAPGGAYYVIAKDVSVGAAGVYAAPRDR